MLDYKFIKNNVDLVIFSAKERGMECDPELVVKLYEERNTLLRDSENIAQQRNQIAAEMKGKMDNDKRQSLIALGKELKEKSAVAVSVLEKLEGELLAEAQRLPNIIHPDAPKGKEEKDNTQIKQVGTVPEFDFEAQDHIQIMEKLDLIDFERAAKVSGSKFYFLKNEAVLLELALSRFALDYLMKEGFTPYITPDLAREEVLNGIGFNPRGEESNIYTVEGTDLCLVGTAEITLGGYHANEFVDLSAGPVLMAGLSHCFRRESGAAGQFSKGLYRVHQFSKVEMFAYCKAEDSDALHEKLLSIEESIFQQLEIPYRVVDTCAGDLGAPAYRKFDLEAWMPGRGETGDWGEVTSASNCRDFQARRLNIRYKNYEGNQIAHTLNGTAIAISRAIVALLEVHQQKDGSVKIPAKLVPYLGFDTINRKAK